MAGQGVCISDRTYGEAGLSLSKILTPQSAPPLKSPLVPLDPPQSAHRCQLDPHKRTAVAPSSVTGLDQDYQVLDCRN